VGEAIEGWLLGVPGSSSQQAPGRDKHYGEAQASHPTENRVLAVVVPLHAAAFQQGCTSAERQPEWKENYENEYALALATIITLLTKKQNPATGARSMPGQAAASIY
jgi:hypothetical protein